MIFSISCRDASVAARNTGERELCIVVIAGTVNVLSEHGEWGELGGRRDPWSGAPDAAYLPPGTAVEIEGSTATGNLVQFNFIGTDVTGTAKLSNGSDGVLLAQGAHGNTIGAGNVVSANAANGVEISGAGTRTRAGISPKPRLPSSPHVSCRSSIASRRR